MSEDVTKKNVVVKNRQTNREIDELAEQYRVIGNRWWLELKEYIEANRSEENAVPLLLVGPTGTGKGLLARYVHHGLHGNWGDGDPKRPFVHVNCALLNKDRLEDQLFGHVKGAFTDAKSDRGGYFQKAKSGTLFLDEFQELTAGALGGLLTAVEDRRVWKMSAEIENHEEVRCTIILGSSKDLSLEEELRPDMYYRIGRFTIYTHPLVKRGADLLVLAKEFIRKFRPSVSTISADFLLFLMTWSWPGNVREIENVLWRLCKTSVLLNGRLLSMEALVRDQSLRLLAFGSDASDQSWSGYASHWNRMVVNWQKERRRIRGILPRMSRNRSVLDLSPAYLRFVRDSASRPKMQFTLPKLGVSLKQLPTLSANDIASGDHRDRPWKDAQAAVTLWMKWSQRLSAVRNLFCNTLPESTLSVQQAGAPAYFDLPHEEAMLEFERAYLNNALKMSGGNKALAARNCGIPSSTFHDRYKRVK